MAIAGFPMKSGERQGENDFPERGFCSGVFSNWLDSFFIVVVVDLGLMLEIFLFDIFWVCFAFNHIFLRLPNILDIFLIFFSFNLFISYLQGKISNLNI